MSSSFYKLYGVLNTKLTKGTYKLSIVPGSSRLQRLAVQRPVENREGDLHHEPELAWRQQPLDVLRLLHGGDFPAVRRRRFALRRETRPGRIRLTVSLS